jgi:hypothetical protein
MTFSRRAGRPWISWYRCKGGLGLPAALKPMHHANFDEAVTAPFHTSVAASGIIRSCRMSPPQFISARMPGEAEFLPQPAETIGDHLRHADNGPAAQHLVIANGLEPLTALDPPCGVGDAGCVADSSRAPK